MDHIVNIVEGPLGKNKLILSQLQLLLSRRILDLAHGTCESFSPKNHTSGSLPLDPETSDVICALILLIIGTRYKEFIEPRYQSFFVHPTLQWNHGSAFGITEESTKIPHEVHHQSMDGSSWQNTCISEIRECTPRTEFETYKSVLLEEKEGQNLMKIFAEKCWNEISRDKFDKIHVELVELKTREKNDASAFFEALDKSSTKWRELGVRIARGERTATLLKDFLSNMSVIKNIVAVQNSWLSPSILSYLTLATSLRVKSSRENRWTRLSDHPLPSSCKSVPQTAVKVHRKSLEKSKNIIVLESDVKPFENQIGGHVFQREKRTKGIMKDAEGNVLKPIPHSGPAEIYFYEALHTTSDHTLLELKQFLPAYRGTSIIRFENEDITCLRLDDVTRGFELPCIMDIKLGVQTWEPNATNEKISRKKVRFAAMKEHLGFGIPGFQYHSVIDGNFVRRQKEFCKIMTPERAVQGIFNFVNGDLGIRYGFITAILEQLGRIYSWFVRQRKYFFFSSSVLLAYDAKTLISLMNDERTEKIPLESRAKIKVCLIDFAHAVVSAENTMDWNSTKSLQKLIYTFENLTDLYEISQREKISIGDLTSTRVGVY